jgi:hypothetical protein
VSLPLETRLPARLELDLLRRTAGGLARRDELQMLVHVVPPFVLSPVKKRRQKQRSTKRLEIRLETTKATLRSPSQGDVLRLAG